MEPVDAGVDAGQPECAITDSLSPQDALRPASDAAEPPRDELGESRLSETESIVVRALTERERDAAFPRVANAYRRLVVLARSTDPIDGILAAHLAREVLSALPGALGVELTRERLQYENRVQDLADHWPVEGRDREPPARVLTDLRQLVEDHERASGRAREGPRVLLSREDRARTGFVPDTSLDHWTDLAGRGAGLAHRLRNLERELPSHEDARRLVDEVTATFLAVVAPHFEGIGEVDRLLALEDPGEGEARYLVALLRTASQHIYFFDRADARWLPPLIVRSLMHRPKVLFLDEPTAGLDAPTRRTLWDHLATVRRESGTTIFLTTHYLEEAEQADQICVIDHGHVVAHGSPASLKAELTREYLVVDADDRARLRLELGRLGLPHAGDGPFRLSLDGRSTHGTLKAIETPLSVVRTHAPSLEDAYLEIVGKTSE